MYGVVYFEVFINQWKHDLFGVSHAFVFIRCCIQGRCLNIRVYRMLFMLGMKA